MKVKQATKNYIKDENLVKEESTKKGNNRRKGMVMFNLWLETSEVESLRASLGEDLVDDKYAEMNVFDIIKTAKQRGDLFKNGKSRC